MSFQRIERVIILGGGSAGFIAALTLKRRLPQLQMVVLRSPDIGVIGVGEGTTASIPSPSSISIDTRISPGTTDFFTIHPWPMRARFPL
jgi:thioredoxin reductase